MDLYNNTIEWDNLSIEEIKTDNISDSIYIYYNYDKNIEYNIEELKINFVYGKYKKTYTINKSIYNKTKGE